MRAASSVAERPRAGFVSPEAETVVHVHVPRTAGTSLRRFFGRHGYHVVDLDINTNDFFTSIDESEWRGKRGQRRPHLFTGHLHMDHSILRRLDGPATLITLLREPTDRMLSNYNYTLRMPAAPWHRECVSGEMSFLENVDTYLKMYGPQFSYYDDTGEGDYKWTGHLTAAECFERLRTRITVFGFVDRMPEFMMALSNLLGLPHLPLPRENGSRQVPPTVGGTLKDTITDAERTALADLMRDDYWFYEQALRLYRERRR